MMLLIGLIIVDKHSLKPPDKVPLKSLPGSLSRQMPKQLPKYQYKRAATPVSTHKRNRPQRW